MARHSYSASVEDEGMSVQEFLESRGMLQKEVVKLFEKGKIFLNGEGLELWTAITASDVVSVNHSKRKDFNKDQVLEEKEIEIPEILYEDEDIIAYNKPSNVLVVADRNDLNTGLLGALRRHNNSPSGPPYLLHRLDRGTSGVWIVAKHTEAKKHINQQFVDNQIYKQYRAIVQGVFFDKEGEINEPIGKHPKHGTKMIVGKGKEASSRYKVLRQFRHYAVVRVWPTTGRTHQIRAHLQHLGHPLLIDELYGGMAEFFLSKIKPKYKTTHKKLEKPLISRLTLHCEAMELSLPSLASTIRIESPLPKDLARLERNFQNYDK